MPFISDACRMSSRSRRPSTVACAGPENGASAAIATIDGFVTRSAHRASDPVEQRPPCFLPHRLGEVVVANRQDIPGEGSGHVGGGGGRRRGRWALDRRRRGSRRRDARRGGHRDRRHEGAAIHVGHHMCSLPSAGGCGHEAFLPSMERHIPSGSSAIARTGRKVPIGRATDRWLLPSLCSLRRLDAGSRTNRISPGTFSDRSDHASPCRNR